MSLSQGGGPGVHQTLAGIAHEYNNLFTVIDGSLALAERHAAGNPVLTRLFANMRVASERAVALTERLVTLEAAEIALPPQPGAPALTGRCVLVVEDDPNVAAVVTAALEQLDLRVFLATSAMDALALLTTIGPVDAVFSDIVMPGGMSGLELARRLEVSHPGTPVLLATGFSREALGADAMRFPVLPKPYSMAELGRRIQGMMTAKT
jgi:CheY-like chemotaxis protein